MLLQKLVLQFVFPDFVHKVHKP